MLSTKIKKSEEKPTDFNVIVTISFHLKTERITTN